MNTAGPCGSVVSKRKLIRIYIYIDIQRKRRKEEDDRPPRYDNARSLAGLRETLHSGRKERAGRRQTKTYNGHNTRWSTLGFSQGRRLHSTRRAFEKITSSGCLFAFGYLEETSNRHRRPIQFVATVRIDSFLVKTRVPSQSFCLICEKKIIFIRYKLIFYRKIWTRKVLFLSNIESSIYRLSHIDD